MPKEMRFLACSKGGLTEIGITTRGEIILREEGSEWMSMSGISYRTRQRTTPPATPSECFMGFSDGPIMGDAEPEAGRWYHYTSVDNAEKILATGNLRLSNFSSANDDWERGEICFDLFCDEDAPSGETRAVSRELSTRLRGGWRFASFGRGIAAWHQADDALLGDQAEGWTSPAMWAHYGGRHRLNGKATGRGAVLVFDRKKLVAAVRKAYPQSWILAGHVRYVEAMDTDLRDHLLVDHDIYKSDGADVYAGRVLMQAWDRLFLTKYVGWSYEREARLAVNHQSEVLIPISDCLEAIILGEGEPTTQCHDLHSLSDELGIKTYQARFRNGFPLLCPSER